ncbi:hypothetical protein [Candidatus Nardonella dryophthoridicola]|uniref:Uncharacterized protein n=1 Tax=endosymbiont of Metamasius hemipterus TaxID=204627 RepID=A0ABT0TW61_9GAMM|nr:hypothetical protein [Candidatus Nardonella dryophthoridicola]MCM0158226.1 hypothetical protein [endosymbiont of Metamasius hemipterus]
MIESFSNELNENIILNAIEYGYKNNTNLINNINDFSNNVKTNDIIENNNKR